MRPFPLLLVLALPAAAQELPASSFTVAAIEFRGAAALPTKELDAALPFKVGDAVDAERVTFARDTLESLYRNRGYLEATAAPELESFLTTATVKILIREGRLWRFGATAIEGLDRLPDAAVRRELPYKEGDPYDRAQLFRAQGRLYNLALFKDISISVSTTTAQTAEVTIALVEQPTRWIKGGIGYGSEERQRLSLIFTHYNFMRRALKLELSATYSAIWLEFKADLVNRNLWGSSTEARDTVSWRAEDRTGYDIEILKNEASLGRQLAPFLRGTLRHRLERDLVLKVDPALTTISSGVSHTSALALIFGRDTTDDPFFPTRGTRAGLLLERSGGFLGGDTHFNKATWDASVYHRLLGPVTGAATVHSGVIRPVRPTREVPIFERFFAGGGNSVRGYKERGVGPFDPAGAPLGGEALLGAGVELHFPLVWRLEGALFLDGAQVGRANREVWPSRWRHGAGGGIRFKTPVGPLRLDLGWKLERDAQDASPWRLHLSLGEAF